MRPVNGAAVIVTNNEGSILCVRANYGKKQWILPGGGIERGEIPRHGGISELAEETGFLALEKDLTLIGLFTQRVVENGHEVDVAGLLCLYHCTKYEGTLAEKVDEEISARAFFSIEEVVALYQKGEFGRGYAAMTIHFDNIRRGLATPVIEARLSDPVAYAPKLII